MVPGVVNLVIDDYCMPRGVGETSTNAVDITPALTTDPAYAQQWKAAQEAKRKAEKARLEAELTPTP